MEGAIFMKDEGKEWAKELEKMKKVNFFPYLITDPVKGDMKVAEPEREDCFSVNHCGRC